MELHQTQKIVAKDNHDFRVVCCGRQWGKTTLAIQEIVACAYSRKNRKIAYFATTFDQARNIAWAMLKEATKNIWATAPNESRLELNIRTQDNGVSYISLRGYESVETARGQQFDLLVIDEIASMKNWKYSWEAILEPTLGFRKGKALFISTPQGYNHFYELYNLGQQVNEYWKSWRFTSYENPFYPKARIEQAKTTNTADYFAQEYLADFRKYTGLVYKDFDRNIHVIKPFDIPEQWEIYCGVDFGRGGPNPTAVIWIATDNEYNYFIIDEFYRAQVQLDELAGVYNANRFRQRVVTAWCDPSSPDWIKELEWRRMFLTPANKEVGQQFNGWVSFGIEKVSEKLKQIPGKTITMPILQSSELRGSSNPSLFVFSTCTNVIREFETYRWKERSVTQAQDLNEPDVPEKANDHAMDALRYMLVSYKKLEQYTSETNVSTKDWKIG